MEKHLFSVLIGIELLKLTEIEIFILNMTFLDMNFDTSKILLILHQHIVMKKFKKRTIKYTKL